MAAHSAMSTSPRARTMPANQQTDIFGGLHDLVDSGERLRLFEPARVEIPGQLWANELAGMQDATANADGENIERKERSDEH